MQQRPRRAHKVRTGPGRSPSWRPPSSSARRAAPACGRAGVKPWWAAARERAAASPAQRGATPERARGGLPPSLVWGRILPFTPEGVLLQEGDARREPPIVLAQCAGTPYRNGHLVSDFVAHPLEPAVCTGRLVAFQ